MMSLIWALTFFYYSQTSIIFSTAGVKRFILKERKHKNELFMWVKSKCTWYKCLISFSRTSFHMLCPAQWCSYNGITKYVLIARQIALCNATYTRGIFQLALNRSSNKNSVQCSLFFTKSYYSVSIKKNSVFDTWNVLCWPYLKFLIF